MDALWISPVYPSYMADFGYDISDYTGIQPLPGTMADFDDLTTGTLQTADMASQGGASVRYRGLHSGSDQRRFAGLPPGTQ
ncbi:alpha-amylase family glycosyl hydrolase [Pontibacter pudoricolor]|uniref:alpha-amylase family glycosyl hydrolase n=1 Tax=Pontibacter pudoricolor TaxID=2694930 RepID=UPI00293BA812|nr:alpha-amylase family glycosyl hydrolase [Pontibacter pudoricolor]